MKKKQVIIIGSDHAGLKAKEYIKLLLEKKQYQVVDMGAFSEDSVDYPDYAKKVGVHVAHHKDTRGILSCGTGIGMSIAANKIKGIRAALASTPRAARLSREHNNANVLIVAGRPFNKAYISAILNVWLSTPFLGGRHERRVRKIHMLEKKG